MLKNSLKRFLVGSRATRLASKLAGKGVAIIMYHSVQDDPSAQSDTLGGIIHSLRAYATNASSTASTARSGETAS